MKHIFASFLDVTKVALLVVVFGFGINTLSAQTWSPAPQNPPSGNVAAPINVSSYPQIKLGAMTIGSTTVLSSTPTLNIFGLASTTFLSTDYLLVSKGFTLANGTQGAGKVLTSNASGLASWQTPAAPSAPVSSGIPVIGPLTDPAGTLAQHQVSFSLTSSSEVIITAYVTALSDAGGVNYVNLLTDGVLKRTAYYGEECSKGCSAGAASVVLSTRQTLLAGPHALKVQTPGGRPQIYTDASGGGGVQFYVYVLTPGASFTGGSTTGVTSIVAGSGVTISPASGTGAVTISSTASSMPQITCPSDMARVTSSTGNQFCVDNSTSQQSTYPRAVSACATAGKAVCGVADLLQACRTARGGYSAEIRATDSSMDVALVNGTCMTSAAANTQTPYLCCLR